MYRPSLLDHLPKTRRGHGAAHFSGVIVREGVVVHIAHPTCVQPTCSLMLPPSKDGKSRGEQHDDQAMNANDWKIEHGFYKVDRKTGDVKALPIPFEECFSR